MSGRPLALALALALVAATTACGPKEGSDEPPAVPGEDVGSATGERGKPAVSVSDRGDASADAGDPDGNVVGVRLDDPELQAAIDEAQRTLDQFIAALARPRSPATSFTIKGAIPTGAGADGPSHEHIWINRVRYDGGAFRGHLANEPAVLRGKKMGDEVTVARADVSDWMIIEGDDIANMKGGFTVKVLMKRKTR